MEVCIRMCLCVRKKEGERQSSVEATLCVYQRAFYTSVLRRRGGEGREIWSGVRTFRPKMPSFYEIAFYQRVHPCGRSIGWCELHLAGDFLTQKAGFAVELKSSIGIPESASPLCDDISFHVGTTTRAYQSSPGLDISEQAIP